MVEANQGRKEAIAVATRVADNGPRELREGILVDEDRHIDEMEAKPDLIRQVDEQLFRSGWVS